VIEGRVAVGFPFLTDVELSELVAGELVSVVYDSNEYVLDVAALTSNYRCIYGQGCQGTTPLQGEEPGRQRPADPSVTGCCRTGPRYRMATAEVGDADRGLLDSPMRIQRFVEALGPQDAQHHERIAAGDWFTEVEHEDGTWASHNTTVAGNCIFLNTEMPAGRTGCALYHLALRLGVEPRRTRPVICHSSPAAAFLIADAADRTTPQVLVTLQPGWFGWFASTGYFCMSDPAAYTAAEPVFRRMASEYTTLLGESVWNALVPTLEQIWRERGEQLSRSWGQPVELHPPRWAR